MMANSTGLGCHFNAWQILRRKKHKKQNIDGASQIDACWSKCEEKKDAMFYFKYELYLKLKQKQKVRKRKSTACGREKFWYALDTCDSFIHKNLASLGSWWLNDGTVFKPWNKYPLGSLCWIAPYLCKELSWVKWLWWAFPEARCFCSSRMEGCCASKGEERFVCELFQSAPPMKKRVTTP